MKHKKSIILKKIRILVLMIIMIMMRIQKASNFKPHNYKKKSKLLQKRIKLFDLKLKYKRTLITNIKKKMNKSKRRYKTKNKKLKFCKKNSKIKVYQIYFMNFIKQLLIQELFLFIVIFSLICSNSSPPPPPTHTQHYIGAPVFFSYIFPPYGN